MDDPRIDAILAMACSDRATDRSRTSIRLAVESADELSDSAIDSCHVLCGLLREGQGVASHILRSQFDVTHAAMNTAMATRKRPSNTGGSDVFSDIQPVMYSTIDFARRLNHSYFGTEHLLFGCLNPETQSATLLTSMGIQLSAVEHEILGLFGHLT